MRYFLTSYLFLASFMLFSQDLDSIKGILLDLDQQNLKLRDQIMPTVKQFGFGSPAMDSLDRLIQKFDSSALAVVMSIIDKHGWLGKSEIGDTGNRVLFITIQHALDSEIRKTYFPLLKKSVEIGESNPAFAATMIDRMLVQEGKDQIYGTQSRMVNGKLESFPIKDYSNVNERRKEVGLPEL
ncbi:MAG: hypothetical protein KI791_12695 [Cyclobacteriaceae bacterium]|nr:hypothetical protein [Cyclobacteriaceae bacterium SS2]